MTDIVCFSFHHIIMKKTRIFVETHKDNIYRKDKWIMHVLKFGDTTLEKMKHYVDFLKWRKRKNCYMWKYLGILVWIGSQYSSLS